MNRSEGAKGTYTCKFSYPMQPNLGFSKAAAVPSFRKEVLLETRYPSSHCKAGFRKFQVISIVECQQLNVPCL